MQAGTDIHVQTSSAYSTLPGDDRKEVYCYSLLCLIESLLYVYLDNIFLQTSYDNRVVCIIKRLPSVL